MGLTSLSQIQVTEWTFNCLAYLFKYLSRLLTTDLVPTYNLLSPLLGKTHQKYFVLRFTAESLSFLVRKCTGDSLLRIVTKIITDVYEVQKDEFYSSAVLLFAETMKSTGNTLHSRSGNILETIFKVTRSVPREHQAYIADLVSDIHIALLQHSNNATANVLFEKAYKFTDSIFESDNVSALDLLLPTKLVFDLAGLRKGTRVKSWDALFSHNQAILNKVEEITSMEVDGEEESITKLSYPLLEASCALLQSSDLKSATSYHSKILKSFTTLLNGSLFLPFTQLLLEQANERFKSFAIPYIAKFMGNPDNEKYRSKMAYYILKLEAADVMNNTVDLVQGKLRLGTKCSFISTSIANTKDFSKQDVNAFSTEKLQELWWNLEVLRASVSIDKAMLFDELLSIFVSLSSADSTSTTLKASLLGKILSIISNMQKIKSSLEDTVLSKALELLPRTKTSLDFLLGFSDVLRTLIRQKSEKLTTEEAEHVIKTLSSNFYLSSSDIRKHSLNIVGQVYIVRGLVVPKLISQCQQISELPLDLANARTLQMHIRNVGINFTVTGTEVAIDNVIPQYLFGLLTVPFQPVWEAAMDALAKVSEKDQKTIWDIAFSWISPEDSELKQQQLVNDITPAFTDEPLAYREPGCTNLKYITEHAHQALFDYSNIDSTTSQYVVTKISVQESSDMLRSQAIKVLIRVPHIAERYARNLVPFILWDEAEDDEEDESAPAGASWTFKDRTAILELFSHFKSPKTIYRGPEIYQRYLYLLGHRLVHIQQVALKCILTYKDPILRKYAENLNGLLDDPRFKDELLLLLRKSGEDEETIHEDDRATVLPIVIRILFGRAQVAKAGNGRQGRRFAVMSALMNVEPQYVRLFVSLAADKIHAQGFFKSYDPNQTEPIALDEKLSSIVPKENVLRRELGFLSMVEEILDHLRGRAKHCLDIIIENLIFSIYNSQKEASFEPGSIAIKTTRSIRTSAAKCVELLFRVMEGVEWNAYFATLYKYFISPRLATFSQDNLENPSGLIKIFVTLSTKPNLVQYLAYDNAAIVKAFFSCLNDERVKDTVVTTVIDTMANVIEWHGNDKLVNPASWNQIVDAGVPIILQHMPELLRRNSTIQLLDKESTLLVKLASGGYVQNNDVRKRLVQVSIDAMERPSNLISLKIKGDILRCLSSMLASDLAESDEIISAYHCLGRMFKQVSDRYARQGLCDLYVVFGQKVEKYARVGSLISSLNAYSQKRLGVPDFDKRLDTFGSINENIYSSLTAEEWTPLLFNLLFFLKDPEELSIRSNAEYSMKRFVDCISGLSSQEEADPYIKLLDEIVLPALKIGLREKSEVFRGEYVNILAHMVRNLKYTDQFADMRCLLFNGDEEANFFNNILHIQSHRRQRAVRRLGILSEQLQLRDTNIAYYLLPIIEHFVENTDVKNSLLSADTITAIGSLTRHLSFNQYRAITKRYISYLSSRPESIKVSVKLVDSVAESLGDPSAVAGINAEDAEIAKKTKKEPFPGAVLLSENLPSQEKLNNFINNDIVPSIKKVLNTKEEETLSIRIPLAIPIIKFLKVLPHDLLIVKIPGVLTTLCQILRSKAQELRDNLRKTLCVVARILGPKYLYFILKELKGALRRGSQLHILGYTVHSLLTELSSVLKPGDLDDSLELLSEIIIEDTFGVTGTEKDADGYTSKMKEVKQQKSFNSAEIVAANITLQKFSIMIEPIKHILLYDKLTLKTEQKIDDLLRRLASGLHSNADADKRDMLVMCYELYKVTQNVQAEEEAARKALEEREAENDTFMEDNESHFIVSLESKDPSGYSRKKAKLHTLNLHILVKFVFETVRQVLGKHESLLTVENVLGFVPFLGDGISSTFEDVQISALKLFTIILRLPIPDVDNKLIQYARVGLEIVHNSPSTNTELCLTALRFISVILRNKENVKIPETALGYILERMKPDLEEPDRQGMAFAFIKSIIARGIVIPEVYDVMDRISQVMVTNQNKATREACRLVYYQFLTEYPQGKERLQKQFKFLVGNLQYPTVEGRLSVMELIHTLLTKIDDVHLEDITTSFFVALVLVIISDDSSLCKESASLLIKKLLARAGEAQIEFIETYLQAWLQKPISEPLLLRGGLQVTGLYFSELGANRNQKLLELSETRITEILTSALPDGHEGIEELDWSVVYFTAQLMAKLAEVAPARVFSATYKEQWRLVERNLLYPHSWVRLACSRLLGLLFSYVREHKDSVLAIKPDDLQFTAFKIIRQLSVANVTEELAFQSVKNLVFIAMEFEAHNVMYKKPQKTTEAEQEEDEEDAEKEEKALKWLVRKVSSILRTEKRAREMQHSKKGAIQFLASVIQLLESVDRIHELEDEIILAFYNFLQPLNDDEPEHLRELKTLSAESIELLKAKVGTTEYLKAYTRVRQLIADRRLERKKKRNIEAVANPELHARKKIKRNERKRETRKIKNGKDENGHYHTKKRRTF